jgi:hypothetical protein
MREPIHEVQVSDPVRAVAALRPEAGISDAALHGRNVRVVGEDETTAAVIRSALGRAGVEVVDSAPVQPSLDDVFAHLVRREGGVTPG